MDAWIGRHAITEALGVVRNGVLGRERRPATVAECRYFGGFTEPDTAQALGVTARTVARDWVKAEGWLYRELADGAG